MNTLYPYVRVALLIVRFDRSQLPSEESKSGDVGLDSEKGSSLTTVEKVYIGKSRKIRINICINVYLTYVVYVLRTLGVIFR